MKHLSSCCGAAGVGGVADVADVAGTAKGTALGGGGGVVGVTHGGPFTDAALSTFVQRRQTQVPFN